MGLFDKKFCDICGEKISLLGNRKLEDGNMCSDCAKLISPFFSGRKHTTIAEMKEHLSYREQNKNRLSQFLVNETYGEQKKVYIDRQHGTFVVSYHSPSNWEKENPDVISLAEVTSCNLDVRENREEEYAQDAQGNSVSYTPPRYRYYYDFYVHINLSSKWFSEIELQLNNNEVEGLNSQGYHNYEMMAQAVIGALTGMQPQSFSCGTGYTAGDIIGGASGFVGAFVNQVAQNAANQQNAGYTNQYTQNQAYQQNNGYNNQYAQNQGYPQNNGFVNQYTQNQGYRQTSNASKIRCSACGSIIEVNGTPSKFCPNCGKQLDANDTVIG